MADWNKDRTARQQAYAEKLKDPRWQKMRLQVFHRDGWRCQNCHSVADTLNVHHLYYIRGHEPWEYHMTAFVTLCQDCHEHESETMKEYEPLLVETLHRVGFRADDFREIGLALTHIPRVPSMSHLASAIEQMFRTPGFWEMVAERYCAGRQHAPGTSQPKDGAIENLESINSGFVKAWQSYEKDNESTH